MKLKAIIALIFFFAAVSAASAQALPAGFSLKGVVIDSADQKPAALVTVNLRNATNQLVKTAVTKSDGSFIFEKLTAGRYTLALVSIGYASKNIPADLSGNMARETDLGTIMINHESKQLQAISITADKPLVRQDVDKMVYDLQADPESKSNSVLEMMRKVPLLSLDGDDNILLKGNANYKILINGKPSSMMERSPKDILRSMPASTIQNIEVITSPSSKYDAEGLDGIINIITARKVDNGYNGSVNISHRFPIGESSAGGSFTFKQGKFGMSVNGGANKNDVPQTGFSTGRTTTGANATNLFQDGYRVSGSSSGYFGSELSYEIDSLNLISGQFNINGNRSTRSSKVISVLDGENGIIQEYEISSSDSGNGYGKDAALNYQRGFRSNKARLLTFSYRYMEYGSGGINTLAISNAVNYSSPDYRQDNDGSSSEQTFQVDYVHPLKKLTIEGGIKGILRRNRSDFQYRELNASSGQFELDPLRTNKFDNRQNVFGAYNSYQYNLSSWGFKAGMRIEETVIKADFISNASQVAQDYFNIIPAVAITKKFKGQSSLNLAFTQRIQRPGIFQLNPFVDRSNPNFESTGNPDLHPTVSNDMRLSYNRSKKGSLNAAFGYTFFNDLIMPVSSFDPATNVTHNTYDNTGRARLFALNLNLNYPLTKKWNFSVNSNIAHGRVQGIVNGSLVKNEGIMYGGSVSSGYRFDSGWRLSGNFYFNGPNLSIQGTSKSFASSSFSINKDIVKDKLSFSVSSNNPFTKFRINHTESFGPDFTQVNESQSYFRSFNASLNYRFGKLKEGIRKNKRGINNDDVQGGQ